MVTRKEYDELVKIADEQDSKKNIKVTELKNTKISSRDQLVGHLYKDAKSGTTHLYMGTINIKHLDKSDNSSQKYVEEVRHVYIRVWTLDNFNSFNTAERKIRKDGNYIIENSIDYPSILSCYYSEENNRFEKRRNYNIKLVKNKIQVSIFERSQEDLFKGYTEEDWYDIEKVYNETIVMDSWGESWSGFFGTHKLNTKSEYKAQL